MFEKSLESIFKKVFELDRVRFDQPDPTPDPGSSVLNEQDTLFIEVSQSDNSIRDGFVRAKVTGKATMIAANDRLPFGYFSKCIAKHSSDTKDLFFYEMEDQTLLHHNLVRRGFSFIYFFTGQYDPAIGNIESVTIEVST